jgi:hypothetical protein
LNKLLKQTTEDDSYFIFDTQELNDIETKVNNSNKVYTNVGCGTVSSQLDVTNLNKIVTGITFPISNKVISDNLNNTINTVLDSTNNPNINQNDMQSVTNDFLSKFMLSLKINLLKGFVASPQLNIINSLSMSFTNNTDKNYDPIQDIKNRKALTKCLLDKIMNSLLESLYNLVKKEVLEIVEAVALIYSKEILERYVKTLKTLV